MRFYIIICRFFTKLWNLPDIVPVSRKGDILEWALKSLFREIKVFSWFHPSEKSFRNKQVTHAKPHFSWCLRFILLWHSILRMTTVAFKSISIGSHAVISCFQNTKYVCYSLGWAFKVGHWFICHSSMVATLHSINLSHISKNIFKWLNKIFLIR